MIQNGRLKVIADLMARIPKDATLDWHEQHGLGAYCHAPVGEYVHRALVEIKRLEAEAADFHMQYRISTDVENKRLHGEINRLQVKLRNLDEAFDALRRDALRYRYWRERSYKDPGVPILPEMIDTLIDAALRGEKP